MALSTAIFRFGERESPPLRSVEVRDPSRAEF